MNEGDFGFLEGYWSKMREPPPKWESVGNYALYWFKNKFRPPLIVLENMNLRLTVTWEYHTRQASSDISMRLSTLW